jgi:fatty acid omega-hydroxylase
LARVSFGISPDTLTKDALATFCTSFDVCQRNVAERMMNPACRTTETLESWLMPWRTSIKQHLANVNDFALAIVAKRREEIAADGGKAKDDLLSRFMNTKNNKDQPLSDKELRDIVLNFIIAGRDTTAQAISWMMYMLLTNPGVRYALLAEINDTITDDVENDPAAMFEAVKKMKYANAV